LRVFRARVSKAYKEFHGVRFSGFAMRKP